MNDQSKEVQPPVLGGELKLSGEYHADVNMLLADIERLNADNVALRTAGELFAAAVPKLDAARAERDTLKVWCDEATEVILRWKAIFGESMARKCELYIKTDEFLTQAAPAAKDGE